ncbi:MAG: hypothetical protein PHS70_11985 [Acidithiobacillus sp.]|nr:hypothetical protein [Acidithiobacillus sp.]
MNTNQELATHLAKLKSIAMLTFGVVSYVIMWWLPIDGLFTGVVLAINKGEAQPVSVKSDPGLYWFFIIFYFSIVTIITFWFIIGKYKKVRF